MKRFIVLLLSWVSCAAWGELISTNLENGPVINEGVNIYRRRGVTNVINLPAGKQLIVHGVNVFPAKENMGYAWGFIRNKISTNRFAGIIGCSGVNKYNYWIGPIIGPKNIEYGLYEAGWSVPEIEQTKANFLFEIKDAFFQSDKSSSGSISKSSVVIPSEVSGEVDIVLEQSSDLLTWAQCLPGTYNSSTQKRFFRVRAIEK